MSLEFVARPPNPSRTDQPSLADQPSSADEVGVRLLLDQHRRARLDQIQAFSFADLANDLDPQARLRATDIAESIIVEIDLALQRLEDGGYGVCLRCQRPIVPERLSVVPYARYCVACTSRA